MKQFPISKTVTQLALFQHSLDHRARSRSRGSDLTESISAKSSRYCSQQTLGQVGHTLGGRNFELRAPDLSVVAGTAGACNNSAGRPQEQGKEPGWGEYHLSPLRVGPLIRRVGPFEIYLHFNRPTSRARDLSGKSQYCFMERMGASSTKVE